MKAICLQNCDRTCNVPYCICYFAMNLAKAVFSGKIALFCGKLIKKHRKKLNYTLRYPPSYKLMWITIKYRFTCAVLQIFVEYRLVVNPWTSVEQACKIDTGILRMI